MKNFENTLYYGDNLDILRRLAKKEPFIDLIYIDPPFNSNQDYNILYEDMIRSEENGRKMTAQKRAFKDTWSNVEISDQLDELKTVGNIKIHQFLVRNREIFSKAQMSYLTMMAIRIYYMRKVLKDTGSFYLHCDDVMNHYLKILCDIIFGGDCFINEITWKRATSTQKGSQYAERSWSRNVDYILFYAKSKSYKINPLGKLSKEQIEKKFKHVDEGGRKYYDDSSHIWRTPNMGERPNLCYEWRGFKNPHPSGWRLSKERLEEEYQKGNIVIKENGKLQRRKYLEDYRGVPISTLWDDIKPVSGKEKLGYDTQKPVELLERIISASSKKGDIVADFFCGCGTTIAAAQKLRRKWLGVDLNHLAIGLIEQKRLKPVRAKYRIVGFPADVAEAEKLAKDDHFAFEQWIVEHVLHGHQTSKTGDGGFDGTVALTLTGKKKLCLLEVKGGVTGIGHLRQFLLVLGKENADVGIFICFDKHVSKGMRELCDMSELLSHVGEGGQITGALSVRQLNILTIEQILAGKYPDWIGGQLQNITYG